MRSQFAFFAGAVALASSVASATVYVSSVTQYNSGTEGFYTNSSKATGPIDPITGENDFEWGPFPTVVSPFSPAYEVDELAGISGAAGKITLKYSQSIKVLNNSAQPEIGVFTNAGLRDRSYPNGQLHKVADSFITPVLRHADVRVSANGTDWVSLGNIEFSTPYTYLKNASSPYLTAVPTGENAPELADFGTPYIGNLDSFNNPNPLAGPTEGLNWTQISALFGNSAGGTWIDVPAGLGLTEIQYVEFSNALDGLYIDTVSANNASVPEPTAIGALLVGSFALLRRRARA